MVAMRKLMNNLLIEYVANNNSMIYFCKMYYYTTQKFHWFLGSCWVFQCSKKLSAVILLRCPKALARLSVKWLINLTDQSNLLTIWLIVEQGPYWESRTTHKKPYCALKFLYDLIDITLLFIAHFVSPVSPNFYLHRAAVSEVIFLGVCPLSKTV